MKRRYPIIPSRMSYEPTSLAHKRLSQGRLFLLRVSLLALSVWNVILYIVGIPVYFAQLFPSNHDCVQDCLTPANLQSLHTLGLSVTDYALYWVTLSLVFVLVYLAVAALIVWRKPADWLALLAAFSFVALGGSFPDIPAALASVHPAWQLPVTLVSENVLGFPSLILFLFLFPNGRFVPGFTRWIAAGAALLFVLGTFFPTSFLNPFTWPASLFLPVPLVIFGSLVVTQVYRYQRVSSPVERQQTKWMVFGATIALLGFLLLGVVPSKVAPLVMPLQNLSLLSFVILLTSIYLLLLLIPLSLAIALLRYRLWDVDSLINKALVYGLLTALLAAIYASLVIGLESLIEFSTRQTSQPVVIVISTLTIWALFQPLRHRIQALIDRRFYRQKYDAEKTLAAFRATLRNEVDLNQLCEHALAVIQETMQPTSASLWLVKPQSALTSSLQSSFLLEGGPLVVNLICL